MGAGRDAVCVRPRVGAQTGDRRYSQRKPDSALLRHEPATPPRHNGLIQRVGQSALEAKNLGIDAILFHQAYDEKESLLFLNNLDMVQGNTNLPIFISARINRDNIDKIIETKPYGIIIGKSITESEDPAEEAKFYYNLCKK